jgi:WhiB family redox-sensing transcriptional regulator
MDDDWFDRAKCRGMDTDAFYPHRGEAIPADVAAACARCPVAADCLEWAVTWPEHHGVWGGVGERTRIRMRRARRHEGHQQRCRVCGRTWQLDPGQVAYHCPDCRRGGHHRTSARRAG